MSSADLPNDASSRRTSPDVTTGSSTPPMQRPPGLQLTLPLPAMAQYEDDSMPGLLLGDPSAFRSSLGADDVASPEFQAALCAVEQRPIDLLSPAGSPLAEALPAPALPVTPTLSHLAGRPVSSRASSTSAVLESARERRSFLRRALKTSSSRPGTVSPGPSESELSQHRRSNRHSRRHKSHSVHSGHSSTRPLSRDVERSRQGLIADTSALLTPVGSACPSHTCVSPSGDFRLMVETPKLRHSRIPHATSCTSFLSSDAESHTERSDRDRGDRGTTGRDLTSPRDHDDDDGGVMDHAKYTPRMLLSDCASANLSANVSAHGSFAGPTQADFSSSNILTDNSVRRQTHASSLCDRSTTALHVSFPPAPLAPVSQVAPTPPGQVEGVVNGDAAPTAAAVPMSALSNCVQTSDAFSPVHPFQASGTGLLNSDSNAAACSSVSAPRTEAVKASVDFPDTVEQQSPTSPVDAPRTPTNPASPADLPPARREHQLSIVSGATSTTTLPPGAAESVPSPSVGGQSCIAHPTTMAVPDHDHGEDSKDSSARWGASESYGLSGYSASVELCRQCCERSVFSLKLPVTPGDSARCDHSLRSKNSNSLTPETVARAPDVGRPFNTVSASGSARAMHCLSCGASLAGKGDHSSGATPADSTKVHRLSTESVAFSSLTPASSTLVSDTVRAALYGSKSGGTAHGVDKGGAADDDGDGAETFGASSNPLTTDAEEQPPARPARLVLDQPLPLSAEPGSPLPFSSSIQQPPQHALLGGRSPKLTPLMDARPKGLPFLRTPVGRRPADGGGSGCWSPSASPLALRATPHTDGLASSGIPSPGDKAVKGIDVDADGPPSPFDGRVPNEPVMLPPRAQSLSPANTYESPAQSRPASQQSVTPSQRSLTPTASMTPPPASATRLRTIVASHHAAEAQSSDSQGSATASPWRSASGRGSALHVPRIASLLALDGSLDASPLRQRHTISGIASLPMSPAALGPTELPTETHASRERSPVPLPRAKGASRPPPLSPPVMRYRSQSSDAGATLSPSALSPSALSPSALSPSALSPSGSVGRHLAGSLPRRLRGAITPLTLSPEATMEEDACSAGVSDMTKSMSMEMVSTGTTPKARCKGRLASLVSCPSQMSDDFDGDASQRQRMQGVLAAKARGEIALPIALGGRPLSGNAPLNAPRPHHLPPCEDRRTRATPPPGLSTSTQPFGNTAIPTRTPSAGGDLSLNSSMCSTSSSDWSSSASSSSCSASSDDSVASSPPRVPALFARRGTGRAVSPLSNESGRVFPLGHTCDMAMQSFSMSPAPGDSPMPASTSAGTGTTTTSPFDNLPMTLPKPEIPFVDRGGLPATGLPATPLSPSVVSPLLSPSGKVAQHSHADDEKCGKTCPVWVAKWRARLARSGVSRSSVLVKDMSDGTLSRDVSGFQA